MLYPEITLLTAKAKRPYVRALSLTPEGATTMFGKTINRLFVFLIAVLVLLAVYLIVTPKPAYAQAIGDYTDLQGNGHHGQGVAPMTGALFPPCVIPCQIGALSPTAVSTNGVLTHRVNSTVVTAVMKATTGRFYGYQLCNTAVSTRYVHIYNKATAPTLGTDTPTYTIAITTLQCVQLDISIGVGHSSGLSWAATTDDVVIPAVAATAGDVVGTLWYF